MKKIKPKIHTQKCRGCDEQVRSGWLYCQACYEKLGSEEPSKGR